MRPERNIRFRHLNAFLEVAGRHSFGAAAAALGVTQPAVSKAIGELEAALGVRLLERSRAGVSLTPEGVSFRRHAGAAVSALSEGVASVDAARTRTPVTVAVGAMPSVAGTLIPAAVLAVKANGFDARIRVITGPNGFLLEELNAGRLDFVVGRMAEPEAISGLQFERLFSETIVFAARPGHPLAAVKDAALGRIAEFPVVLPPSGSIIRPEADRLLNEHGIGELKDVIETVSPVFSVSYLKESDAIWIITRSVVSTEIAEGGLVELPIDTGTTSGPVGLTTRPGGLPSVAADTLVGAIRRAAAA